MIHFRAVVFITAASEAAARNVAEEIDRHFGRKAGADVAAPYVTVHAVETVPFPELVARRTFRTGVQSLWRYPDGYHTVSIRNRTYKAEHPIPPDKVAEWERRLSSRKGEERA